jgi:adenylyltransferase/sulfurtransferase
MDSDRSLYFKRQIDLWGEEAQEMLREKRILIVGCGGLGSSLSMALGGSGIGHIDLVDFDEIDMHNIHRQISFTMDDIGMKKAEVAAREIEKRCPFVTVTPFVKDFSSFCGESEGGYDLILDATDNMEVRKEIDSWASKEGTPWLYGSVERFEARICLFEKASFSSFASAEHIPGGVTAPMVMHTASIQAGMALRYLAGLPVEKDILYYIYYDRDGLLVHRGFAMPAEEANQPEGEDR